MNETDFSDIIETDLSDIIETDFSDIIETDVSDIIETDFSDIIETDFSGISEIMKEFYEIGFYFNAFLIHKTDLSDIIEFLYQNIYADWYLFDYQPSKMLCWFIKQTFSHII